MSFIKKNNMNIKTTVKIHIHHAENIKDNPSNSILPKLLAGGCTPSPKKFNARFIMIISGILASV